MVNNNKTFEVNRIPVTAGINGSSPQPGIEGGKKKGEPVYEAKLMAGVNRVEVEIVAEKERKTGEKESRDPKEQIESEKCTIFLHLTRSVSAGGKIAEETIILMGLCLALQMGK